VYDFPGAMAAIAGFRRGVDGERARGAEWGGRLDGRMRRLHDAHSRHAAGGRCGCREDLAAVVEVQRLRQGWMDRLRAHAEWAEELGRHLERREVGCAVRGRLASVTRLTVLASWPEIVFAARGEGAGEVGERGGCDGGDDGGAGEEEA
jgi:hypothetical protein